MTEQYQCMYKLLFT